MMWIGVEQILKVRGVAGVKCLGRAGGGALSGRVPRGQKRGFSLVELIVVIAIVGVLLSVAAVGIQAASRSQASTAAISVSESIFDEARRLAIGRGTRARVCIHADRKDSERYLRYLVVVYERLNFDENGQVVNRVWEAASRGTYLAPGAYFSPEKSLLLSRRSTGLGRFEEKDVQIKFPGAKNNNPDYFFYEFNSQGLCIQPNQQFGGGAFVVVGGTIPKGRSEPIVKRNDVEGFIVFQNGMTKVIDEMSSLLERGSARDGRRSEREDV